MRAPGRLGVAHRAPPERLRSGAARGPSRCGPQASATQALSPSSRASRSNTVPPSSVASRRSGGNARRGALAQAPRDRGPHVPNLAGEVLRRALEQPRPAQPAGEAARAERRRHAGVVGRDVAPREQRGGREHQQLERALDVRRALREQPRRQHVQLALGGPADEVAPARRRRQPALERQPGLARRRAERPSRARPPPARRAGAESACRAARARTRAGRGRARRRARHVRRGAR